MACQSSFFCHSKSIQGCLPRFNAAASMNIRSFQLRVSARNRYYDLIPQFVYRKEGKYQYSPVIPADGDRIGFIGWLPYFNKRWPAGTNKLAFKEFCSANGLRTPRYSTQTVDGLLNGYVIKQPLSSFGYNMRGPFKGLDQTEPQSRAGENEYYEEFIPGKIAKAWYWNDKLVCLELLPMPTVIGDGTHSLAQLIANAVIPPNAPLERGEFEALARYQNASVDGVVPAGKILLVDFRYGSPLFPSTMENRNVIAKHAGTDAGRQFVEAGLVLWSGIPEDRRRATLYTVDAIVDTKDRAWFLEMNCNPMVHPDAYVPMFEDLFGPAQEAVPNGAPALTAMGPGTVPPHNLSHPWPTSAPPPGAFASGPFIPPPGTFPPGTPPPGPLPAGLPGFGPKQTG